ncbi:MerR family transcriptional regulator [Chitinophaga sancti]|uniref:MerR family transcriptional regulator n=3 Tax=Chitinophaga sancti TaxID=1004 RepID=A0ABZ0XBJ0_9BACT|nr:MerR family transcriptional regulator [Chitinophaga sancti]WQG87684.1 MerR family transcriptional regulator [Chitinophaga sancti]
MMQQLDLFSNLEPKKPDPATPPVPEKELLSTKEPLPDKEPEPEQQQKPVVERPKMTETNDLPNIPSRIQVQLPPDIPPPLAVSSQSVTASQPPQKKRGRKSLKEVSDDPDLIKTLESVPLDKQYYSISEVATMFKVNTSLIRYWENEFDILQPKKNRKGDRLFRQEDIQHLKLIYHLLRERKYTIEGAKQKLKEDRKLAARNFEMVQALLKVKGFLTELKEQL